MSSEPAKTSFSRTSESAPPSLDPEGPEAGAKLKEPVAKVKLHDNNLRNWLLQRRCSDGGPDW